MTRVEKVQIDERDALLTHVLVPLGGARRASATQVESFVRYMSTCGLWWAAWRCRRERQDTALLFVLFLPGQSAIAMFPRPDARRIRLDDQEYLLAAVLERLTDHSLYYVQALIEPEAEGKRGLVERAGFAHLTRLIYMQRSGSYPWFDPPGEGEATWATYHRANHEAFARMLLATYEDSQDCPELGGLRPIDAVIASHKASGPFDPALWELAGLDGEHAGCILLSRLAHGPLLEVVYMGVARVWRGRGIGKLLLRRALERCRASGASGLTAAVDARNAPARQLYAQFGFKPVSAREAYIHTWPAAGG